MAFGRSAGQHVQCVAHPVQGRDDLGVQTLVPCSLVSQSTTPLASTVIVTFSSFLAAGMSVRSEPSDAR